MSGAPGGQRCEEERMPRRMGYSLLEVLVALGLLASVTTVVLHVLSVGVQNTRAAAYRTRAVLAAEELIERLRLARPEERPVLATQLQGDLPEGCSAPEVHARASGSPLVAVNAWRAELGCALPDGKADLELDGERIMVELSWQPVRAEAPASIRLEGRL